MLSKSTTDLITRCFIELGMSDEHSQIYLTVLTNGSSSVSMISKLTKIPRTSIYDLLGALEDWQLLIQEKHRKKAIYTAQDPSFLLEQIRYKKNRLSDTTFKLEKSIHQLEVLYTSQISDLPPFRIFTDINGIKEVFADIYRAKEVEGFSYLESVTPTSKYHAGKTPKAIPQKTGAERFLGQCALRGISLKHIFIGDVADAKDLEDEIDEEFIQAIVIQTTDTTRSFQYNKFLYGGKVSLISRSFNYALMIEDDDLYEFEKTTFELIWRKYFKTHKINIS